MRSKINGHEDADFSAVTRKSVAALLLAVFWILTLSAVRAV
jgi:hypothetical protein